jgi:ribosomal-protein-alanine acetyltransferase
MQKLMMLKLWYIWNSLCSFDQTECSTKDPSAIIYRDRKICCFWQKNEEFPCQLVGYILVLLHKRSARIYSLAVNPENQMRGIGRELIQESMKRIQEKGIMIIFLELRKDNSAALRLYESLGFIASGFRPNYYQCEGDAIVMTWQQNG